MTRSRSAFTLIEILIVVTILGIMAMIVVPRYTEASSSSRGAALADQARIYRDAINVYRAQHQDRSPATDASGAITSDADLFRTQLTTYTDGKGATSPTKAGAFVYGPYLPSVPANPISGLKTISIVNGMPTPTDSTGWFYQPSTGKLWPNNSGRDSNGKAFFDY